MQRIIMLLTLLFVIPHVQAYPVKDVKVINQLIAPFDVQHWVFRLADYGFVEGRDHLTQGPELTLGIIPNGLPCEDYNSHPFIMLTIDQGRFYGRGCQDWTDHVYFVDGVMDIYMWVDADMYLKDVTLEFAFEPGIRRLPEPSGIGIFLLGGLALIVRRQLRNL